MNDKIFDPTAMSIIQDTNFDPMAILHGDQKIDKETPIVKMKTDEPGDDDKTKAAAVQDSKTKTIDLSDDMIIQGLQRTKGVEVTSKDDDDTDTGSKNKKPVVDNTDPNNAFAVHYKLMVEAGEWEPLDGFDGSQEKYMEARMANDEKRALDVTDNWFSEAFEKNPEGAAMGRQLFNHLRAGGRVSDFVELMAPAEFKFEDIHSDDDAVSEDASKELIRQYYSTIGWKPEKINTRIQGLIKTGQLVDEAKQVEDPYKDLIQTRVAAETKRNETLQASRQKEAVELTNTLTSKIEGNHSFGEIKLWGNKKEMAALKDYILAADPETKRTAYSDELNKAFKDPDFLLFTAAALKNEWHKKGITGLSTDNTDAKNKATNDLKTTLEGALLNKKINSNNSSGDPSSSPSQKSKFVFDLENAVVIS